MVELELTFEPDLKEMAARVGKPKKYIKKHISEAMNVYIKYAYIKAKARSPYKTGKLMRSHRKSSRRNSLKGRIYTNIRYGGFVHDGTSRNRSQPWLFETAKLTEKQLRYLMEKAVKNAMMEMWTGEEKFTIGIYR